MVIPEEIDFVGVTGPNERRQSDVNSLLSSISKLY